MSIPSKKLGSPSAESEVFQGQFETLSEHIQSKLKTICEELLSKNLIDDSEHRELIDDGKYPKDERAKRLLRTVERRIKDDHNRFGVFLKVLKVMELSDLASQLKSNLEDYKSKYKLLVDNHLF